MATTSTHPVVAEKIDDERVRITFDYSPDRITRIKRVPSARFQPREKGGPAWLTALDLPTMRKLREQFGDELGLGPELIAWGHGEVTKEKQLSDLSQADDADLDNVPDGLIKGCAANGDGKFALRPYQRADVKFMSTTNVINANQPGAGKTIETIAAMMEQDLAWGQHLVFAPVTSLRTVWEAQLRAAYKCAGLDEPTILTGDTPAERKAAIKEAVELAKGGYAFWLVLNPYHAQLRRKKVEGTSGDSIKFTEQLVNPELLEVEWDTITIDEFHLMGLSNPTTAGARGVKLIAEATQPGRRYALSGTPMGGKPIKLFGALQFLDPGSFTSRWHWARHWLVINHNGYGHNIEGITPGREADFYNHLKPYLVRRTKREALPGLPPKQRINVLCEMTDKQKEQYVQFANAAEWHLEDMEESGRLTASNVLAMYTRLKQFADAYCTVHKTGRETAYGVEELDVRQTEESGKLDQLLQKLAEENVITQGEDDDDPKVALVFSQFNGMVEMVSDQLRQRGVPVGVISGAVTGAKRTALVNACQTQSLEPLRQLTGRQQEHEAIKPLLDAGTPPRVLVMNTMAGGSAINLSVADSVHILDETWVPDNQEQAEDRAHRGDDITMGKDEIRMYYYRSRLTVEQHIEKLVASKALNNKTVLDLRRKMARDLEQAKKELGQS